MGTVTGHAVATPTWRAHLQIARIDHWVKNVFVLPGVVVALGLDPSRFTATLLPPFLLGMLSVGCIASSNYVLNELLDAPYDRQHPIKRRRPAASGQVHIGLGYLQWLVLMAIGLLLAWQVGPRFTMTMAALWVMGCAYNVPPVRTKDVPYLDVLSEAVNNPLRMLAGWYIVGTDLVPPVSLLISYWMAGCYFMAIKRFAEYREIGDAARSAAYRRSFAYYNEPRLLVSIMFYGSHAMLFLGAFLVRYRLELILAFPFTALVMAVYLALAFKPDSAAQRPEGLYAEPVLMAAVVCCAVLMTALMFVDVPFLYDVFRASVQR